MLSIYKFHLISISVWLPLISRWWLNVSIVKKIIILLQRIPSWNDTFQILFGNCILNILEPEESVQSLSKGCSSSCKSAIFTSAIIRFFIIRRCSNIPNKSGSIIGPWYSISFKLFHIIKVRRCIVDHSEVRYKFVWI